MALGVVVALGLALAAAPAASAEPSSGLKKPEILREKPSGFWTSNRPATHGAYRWRLLGIAVVILGATGYATLRLVKRASVERQGRT